MKIGKWYEISVRVGLQNIGIGAGFFLGGVMYANRLFKEYVKYKNIKGDNMEADIRLRRIKKKHDEEGEIIEDE